MDETRYVTSATSCTADMRGIPSEKNRDQVRASSSRSKIGARASAQFKLLSPHEISLISAGKLRHRTRDQFHEARASLILRPYSLVLLVVCIQLLATLVVSILWIL
jgi:hypothetical protein